MRGPQPGAIDYTKQNMKFIRFGSLSPVWQRQYVANPTDETSPHKPPRRNGIYAFPLGYFDPFFLYRPYDRTASSKYAITEYLRDENGEKITKRRFEESKTVEYPLTELELNKITLEFCQICENKDDSSPALRARKNYLARLIKDNTKFAKKLYDNSIADILKKKRIKEEDIVWEKRPSFIMFMKDPEKPPKFIDDDPTKGLDQPLEFLLDDDGGQIWADEFLHEQFSLDNYHGFFEHVTNDDIRYNWKEIYGQKEIIPLEKWLAQKGLTIRHLCVWPVYPKDENLYATIYKKSRMFQYDGCLWHHLGDWIKHSEVLDQYGLTWFYTDIKTFEKALKKSDPKRFSQVQDYLSKDKNYTKGGLYTFNATLSISGMYEVFIDQKI